MTAAAGADPGRDLDMIGTLPQYHDLHGGTTSRMCTWTAATTRARPATLLDLLGFEPHIAIKGQPAPIQAGQRWPVERLHAWMNGYGKLRRCTESAASSSSTPFLPPPRSP